MMVISCWSCGAGSWTGPVSSRAWFWRLDPILLGNSQQKIYNAKVQKQMLIGQQCFLIYRRQSGICGHPCRQMSTGYVIFSLNGGIGWYWSVGSYQMVVQGQTATGEVRYEAHIRWPWLWSIATLPVFGQQKLGFLKLMALYGYIDFLFLIFICIYIYITDMWNINTNNLLCVYISIYRSNDTNRLTGPKYSLDYI